MKKLAILLATVAVLFGAFVAGSLLYGRAHGFIRDDHPVGSFRDAYSSSGPEVLFFGSSVFDKAAPGDEDRRHLGQLLEAELEGDRVFSCRHDAYYARIFRLYIELLETLPGRPQVVIVPVNLRSFSASWHRHPNWQFRTLTAILKSGARSGMFLEYALGETFEKIKIRPHEGVRLAMQLEPARRGREAETLVFRGAPLMTFEAFDRIYYEEPRDEEGWRRKRELQYRVHYLDPVKEDHPVLAQLLELRRILRRIGVPVLFYFTPIDLEDLRRHCPDDAEIALQSLQTVGAALIREEASVLDLSSLLPSRHFFSTKFSTEHVDAEGKRETVRRVAEHLRREMKVPLRWKGE